MKFENTLKQGLSVTDVANLITWTGKEFKPMIEIIEMAVSALKTKQGLKNVNLVYRNNREIDDSK